MSKKSKTDTEWYCPFCFLLNESNPHNCDACNAWKCPSCHNINDVTLGKCSTCHKAKPSSGVSPKNKKKKRRKHKGKKAKTQIQTENIAYDVPSNNPPQQSPVADALWVPGPRNTGHRQNADYQNAATHYNYTPPKAKASAAITSNNNSNPWKHPYRKSNARSYPRKRDPKSPKKTERIQVTLNNQAQFKTEDNLRRNMHAHSQQHSVHNMDEEDYNNYSNDHSNHSNQNNHNAASPASISISPQRVYKRRPPPPMRPTLTDVNVQRNTNIKQLDKRHQNVDTLLTLGYTLQQLEVAWGLMKENKNDECIAAHDGMLFIETMLNYLKVMSDQSEANKRSECGSNASYYEENEYYDEEERYRMNGYQVNDVVYFRGRKCNVLFIDIVHNPVLYTVRFCDDNTDESTVKMYLSWKPDIYNDELSVAETSRNMNINNNWRYNEDNEDNHDDHRFYAPQRHQILSQYNQ